MIPNPIPIAATDFNGQWVTSFSYAAPQAGRLNFSMAPYNGTDILTSKGVPKDIALPARVAVPDEVLSGVLLALTAEMQRQAQTEAALNALDVRAPYPDQPVMIRASFSDGKHFVIADGFAKCEEDSAFAAVFTATMGELARQAAL